MRIAWENASLRDLRVNFHAKCKQYLKMATFLRFFRPLKTKFWNDIYLQKTGKSSLHINRNFYKISNVVKLSNNGVFRRDDVDIKDSENSGSSVKTAYLLGIAASFLVCLFGKKISAVGDDEMTKEQSFSSRARGLKGQFSSGRNQTAAVNAKLRKMNMARQKCKRKLDTETDDSTVQEDAALNIITRNGLVSKTSFFNRYLIIIVHIIYI